MLWICECACVLTWKLCLMKVNDGFGAAWTTNSYFFLPAILLNFILKVKDSHQACKETTQSTLVWMFLIIRCSPSMSNHTYLCIRWLHYMRKIPGSCAALPDVHYKSSSQIWEARPGPISSFVNGPLGSQISYSGEGRLCWTRNEGYCNKEWHTIVIFMGLSRAIMLKCPTFIVTNTRKPLYHSYR